MKMINSTAVAALLVAALSLSAAAPSFAQDATPPAQTEIQAADNGHHKGPGGNGGPGMNQDDNGPRRGGGLGGLFNFERGSEAIEIAFVRISHAITLTDAQKPLLDELKTTAIAAATEFQGVLEAARPAADATARPEIADMLKSRIAIETAHAKALSTILPKLEAFTSTLTDEQKAALAPQRDQGQMGFQQGDHGPRGNPDGHRNGPRNGNPGAMQAPVQPPVNG